MTLDENNKLAFGSALLLGINAVIGSGIFLLPGKVFSLVGNSSLLVYACTTFLVLCITWCFAQCAKLFTRNGGAYLYAKEAFGDFIGFEIGVMRWFVGIIAWASLTAAFVTALNSIYPIATEEPMRSILVLSFIGILAVINILGVKVLKPLNNLIAIAKLLPLLFLILFGVFFMKQSHFIPTMTHDWNLENFGPAVLILFYIFGGFETFVVVAGEMKNPTKNLPKAVLLVISFCAILYFLIQIISIGLLGEGLANSATPIADSAQLIIGPQGKVIIALAMLTSIGGSNIVSSFATPRSAVAMAEDGMMPSWIGVKGRFGTPTRAILVTVFFTSIIALSGDFVQLASISVVSRFGQYISTILASMVLQVRYRKNRHPVIQTICLLIPIIALSGVLWLILQASLLQLMLGLGALFLIAPIYPFKHKFKQALITE